MADETERTVTIGADYFAELYAEANSRAEAILTINEIARERDELKAKLDEISKHDAIAISYSRLTAAERCIEDIEAVMSDGVISDCAEGMKVHDIIRAWREKREAK